MDRTERVELLECRASWSEASRRMALNMAELSAEPGVCVRSLDVDRAEPEALEQLQLRVLPTVLILRGGQEFARLEGEYSLAELRSFIHSPRTQGAAPLQI